MNGRDRMLPGAWAVHDFEKDSPDTDQSRCMMPSYFAISLSESRMPAPSRSQQQLIIGEVAWIVLDLYAASLARGRSGESANGGSEARMAEAGDRPYGRRRDDPPVACPSAA